MPTFGMLANRLVAEHDAIQLHLPQFDAAGVALRGRLLKKPTVITYHCDLLMPPGLLALTANLAVKVMNNLAALTTHRIVTYTRDYAENSPYLRRYMHKLRVIPPPVELPAIRPEAITSFAMQHNPDGRKPVIGMAGRFATEKGIEVLLNALPRILAVLSQMRRCSSPVRIKILSAKNIISSVYPRGSKNTRPKAAGDSLARLTPSKSLLFIPTWIYLCFPALIPPNLLGWCKLKA